MKQPDKQRTPEELKAIETALCQVREAIVKALRDNIQKAWQFAAKPDLSKKTGEPSAIHRYFFADDEPFKASDAAAHARHLRGEAADDKTKPNGCFPLPEIWPREFRALPIPLPRETIVVGTGTMETRKIFGIWAVNTLLPNYKRLSEEINGDRKIIPRRDKISPLLATFLPTVAHKAQTDSGTYWGEIWLGLECYTCKRLVGALKCSNPWLLLDYLKERTVGKNASSQASDDEEAEEPPFSKAQEELARQDRKDANDYEKEKSWEYVPTSAKQASADKRTVTTRERIWRTFTGELWGGEGYGEILAELAFAGRALAHATIKAAGDVPAVEAQITRLLRDPAAVWDALRYLTCLDAMPAKSLRFKPERGAKWSCDPASICAELNAVAHAFTIAPKGQGSYAKSHFKHFGFEENGDTLPLADKACFPSCEGPIEQGIRFSSRRDKLRTILRLKADKLAPWAKKACVYLNPESNASQQVKPVVGTPFAFPPPKPKPRKKTPKRAQTRKTDTWERKVDVILKIRENVNALPNTAEERLRLRNALLAIADTKEQEKATIDQLLPGLTAHYARYFADDRPERNANGWLTLLKTEKWQSWIKKQIKENFPDKPLASTTQSNWNDTEEPTAEQRLQSIRDYQFGEDAEAGAIRLTMMGGDTYETFLVSVFREIHVKRTLAKKNKKLPAEGAQDQPAEEITTQLAKEALEAFRKKAQACANGDSAHGLTARELYEFFMCFSSIYPLYYASKVTHGDHQTWTATEPKSQGKEANHGH